MTGSDTRPTLTLDGESAALESAVAPVPETVGGRLPGSISLYYAGYAIGRFGTFAALPIISRVLGVEGFGRFEVYVALLLIATVVLDAGAGASIVRFYEDSRFSHGHLLRAAAYVQAVASLVAIAVVAPAVMILVSPAILGLTTVVLFAGIEGFAVIGGALLRVQGRDRRFFGFSLVRFGITVGVGSLGAAAAGAVGALFGIALGGLAFALFAIVTIARESSGNAGPAARAIVRYGLPLVATTAMTWCLAVSDRVFLNANVSAEALGEYGANYRLGSVIAVFLAGPLVLAWVPTIRRAAGEWERIEMCIRWSSRFALVSLGCLVLVLAASARGVPIVFGSEFSENHLVIVASGLSGWLLGLSFLLATPILLRDRTGMLAVVAASVVVVNLVLNTILIPSYGVSGAAIATVSSYFLFCLMTLVAAGLPNAAWVASWPHIALIAELLGCVLVAIVFPGGALVAVLGIAVASGAWADIRRRGGGRPGAGKG